jgi:hypothetical protein
MFSLIDVFVNRCWRAHDAVRDVQCARRLRRSRVAGRLNVSYFSIVYRFTNFAFRFDPD